MKFRRSFMVLGSLVAGATLAVVLVRFAHISLATTVSALRQADGAALAGLLILNCILIYLSTEKWLSVDAVLRRPGDSKPPKITAFFVTSMGMALGLLLPVQLGMTISRTLSTQFFGRALRRGTGGTLVEQGFDLLIVIIFAAASLLTSLWHGHALVWFLSALVLLMTGVAAVAPALRGIRTAMRGFGGRTQPANHRHMFCRAVASCRRRLTEMQESGLFGGRLVRRMFLLSVARFFALVGMASCAAQAVRIHVPLWQFCAAMPFATLANLLAITPGGIGVNELASVSALHIFGTPLSAAAQWALINRILVTGACLAVAGCAALAFALNRLTRMTIRISAEAGERKRAEGC